MCTYFYRKTYPGDLSSDDFATPRKRKRNLLQMKSALQQKDVKIKSLRSHNSYLKRKVNNLKSLLDYFRKNALVSENAENIIKVCILIQ